MIKSDPIIAVKDVEASSQWYQSVFDCKSKHGGNTFDVLVDLQNEVFVCLHKWGQDEHPTMLHSDLAIGNGLILYFRTNRLMEILKNIENINHPLSEEMHVNPNTGKEQFALRDPDGYYLIVSEFHEY